MRSIYIILATLLLAACQQQESIDKVKTEARDTLNSIKSQLDKLAPHGKEVSDLASDEVEKLFNFEYNVVSVDIHLEPTELTKTLNKLGEERWDCFSILPRDKTLEILCKRKPKSYLRYVPGLIK